ncbi:MAG: hypothetical protein Q4G09_01195, partial [Clostridia bacterium]|nr:hypothetical protein [Clostridia bacterium]
NSNINIVVNYTLDNYIKIYGKIDGTYITKSGYLIDTGDIKIKDNKIEKDNIKIKPENLSEQVLYYNKDGTAVCGVYDYIYEAKYNTKVYFDNDRPFQVNSNGVRTDLSDSTSTYKKLSIKTGDDTYTEIYQGLVDDKKEKWYTDETLTNEVKTDYDIDLKQDTSAINYYVESYIFSKWVENNLGDIQIEDIKLQDGEESEFTTKDPIFKNIEGEDSVFTKHKREVIKQVLIRNLNQAITSYSRNSEGEYQLPQLLETDWDKILTNVSITTFVQGIPIGMKYYNNYAIATSTSNKEYVNPDEIYLSNSSTYHMPYCEEFENNENIVGYKSIDYRLKKSSNTGEEYYKQGGNKEACYYCLIQRSLYEETENEKQQELQKTAYETALARERYVANPTT